jgi:hypothetical protein
MKKLLVNLAIALSAVAVACGLVGTPVVQDLLPVDFMLPADGHASHQHFRALLTVSQSHHYLAYALIFSGLVALAIAVVIRRRLRGTAA